MFTRSQSRARANDHASLWPFYALRRITFWAGLLGAGYGALLALMANAPAAVPILGVGAALATFALGLIPAAALSILDAVFVGPRRLRGSYPAPSVARSHQSPLRWTVAGGATGAAVGLGYAVVYLNAFNPASDTARLFATSITVALGAGLVAGLLTAIKLNAVDHYVPATGLTLVLKRGSLLWAITVAGMAVLGLAAHSPSLERTLLPAAILAAIGAGVVPQLAADIATRSSNGSIEEFPIAPSPRPINPEGGLGEGAEGELEIQAAQPHRPTRSKSDSIEQPRR
jgi:hypothetical protein